MSAIPGVNYSSLGVPFLDTVAPLSAGISPQPGHKAISLAQSQLMFDPQMRVNQDPDPSTLSRYDGSSSGSSTSASKALRSEAFDVAARNSLLEAARAWGGSSANLTYNNQFGSFMPEVPVPLNPLVSSPSAGSLQTSQKLTESSSSLSHDNPPPAHSSRIPRSSASQRTPSISEPFYVRSLENPIPSSLSHLGSLYSTSNERDATSNSQQSLHRQTPGLIHGYSSSHEDIKDLSANAQNQQLYGSYANLSAQDAQDFSVAHISGDINYEAVSPAAPTLSSEPPQQQTQSHSTDNPSFPMNFSEFVHMTSDQPQNLTDKYQESEYRLKMEERLQVDQDAMSFSQGTQENRQDIGSLPKSSKNLPSYVMHRPSSVQQSSQSLNIPQSLQAGTTTTLNQPNPLLQHQSAYMGTVASLQQQNQNNKPPIQAMADSTTKPKRQRRKKKDTIAPAAAADPKKSTNNTPISQESLNSIQRQQQIAHNPSNLLSMPPSSQISTLSSHPPSHMTPSSHLLHQQSQAPFTHFVVSSNNQISSQDSRAQTPSIPQNYSTQEQQQGYLTSPSPKILPHQQNQQAVAMQQQAEFTVPPQKTTNQKRGGSQKQTTPKQQGVQKQATPKQGSRKSKQSTAAVSKANTAQNSRGLYSATIIENPLNMQNYGSGNSNASLMGQATGQRNSPMLDARSSQHISRLPGSFAPTPDRPQQHSGSMTSQMAHLSQQSPHGSIPMDSSLSNYSHTSKLNQSGSNNNSNSMTNQYMNSPQVQNMSGAHSLPPQSPMPQGNAVGIDQNSMAPHHGYVEVGRNSISGEVSQQQQEANQYQMEFGSQPFLEQLVEAGAPPGATTYSHSVNENGEVVFTALGTPLQNQGHPGSGDLFKQAYDENIHHDVRPVGTLTGNLSMGSDVTFTPFYENQPGMGGNEQLSAGVHPPHSHPTPTPPEPPPMTLTFVPEVNDDDDFSHFSSEQDAPVEVKLLSVRDKSELFQESFLSYLQGNKMETLSSVSSSTITKRPQLPKYIPEPRRPRPPLPPIQDTPSASSIVISDDEKLNYGISQREDGEKGGYSVKRKSELVFKITLPKGGNNGGLKSSQNESALLSHNRKMKEGHPKLKKRKGKYREDGEEDYLAGADDDGDDLPHAKPAAPPTPVRASIGRKAKDKVVSKSRSS